MSLAVIDASVMTSFYAIKGDDPRRKAVAARLSAGTALFAPAHLDAEVVSALRGLAVRSSAIRASGPAALRHLELLPIRRMPLAPLLQRMWELQENVTAYGAALAERLDATLITSDTKLASASGTRCAFDVIT